MNEADYQPLIEAYLDKRLSVEAFSTAFMRQWKTDRDTPLPTAQQTPSDARFQRLMNRLFTSCDCYDEHPESPFEIAESTLREEVALFHHIWWG